MPPTRILILCTGNSCRSQMAEGVLRALDPELEVYSAGTDPAPVVHPLAVEAMQEIGIDVSGARPKHVDEFLHQSFDYVITVCGDARETCPSFSGRAGKRVHIEFEDPARAQGPREKVMEVFRRVRDQIRERFAAFYKEHIEPRKQRR